MHIVRTLSELRAACDSVRATRGSLALVPTMGALHQGHAALVRAAVASGGAVVTSIFVNPLQFSPNENLSRYPRDEAGDLALLKANGCDIAWLPDVETLYTPGDATTITVAGPAEGWEGAARPGHFRGVATVCARLFGHTRADRAYFGEKDWQQLQVIRRMVADVPLPVEIAAVPTVREADGLALSSRNRFLTTGERALAPLLYRVLNETASVLTGGEDADAPLRQARERLAGAGFEVEYFTLVDGPGLTSVDRAAPGARLIATALLGGVRLLDNLGVG